MLRGWTAAKLLHGHGNCPNPGEPPGYSDWAGRNESRQHCLWMDDDVTYACCCVEYPRATCPNVDFCEQEPWKDVNLCYSWCIGAGIGQKLPDWCVSWDKTARSYSPAL
jgi:hypothetical protein